MPVYKDEKRGTWWVSVRYTNWAGQPDRKVKRGFSRERDAKAWERDFLFQQSRSCDMTVSALWELYREDDRARLRESTRDSKDSLYRTHIEPYWKDTPVNTITPADVRKWQNTLVSARKPDGDPYKPTYLRSIHSRFSALMNYAVTFYHLPANPCRASGSIGAKKRKEFSFWTLDQFNQVITYVDAPAKHLALMILFWLGLREGECLALTAADLGDDGYFSISKTFHRRKGREFFGPPKSDNGIRYLAAPNFLIDEFRKYCGSLYDLKPSDRIFYFGKSTLGRELDRAAACAGIPRIRLHDLRHSNASLLIKMGYDIPMLAARLGDSMKVVSETYAHLYPKAQDHVAAQMDAVRFGMVNTPPRPIAEIPSNVIPWPLAK